MKAIQISFDEQLLRELDASDEVRKEGRSAVMRRAVAEYLHHKRQHKISESYRRAYTASPELDDEFEGWEEQGQWPAD